MPDAFTLIPTAIGVRYAWSQSAQRASLADERELSS